MSHGFSTWQLAITPLAPVHIGTGNDYEPTQYVIDSDSGALFSFSPEAAMRALPAAARADLLRILNGKPDVALIKAVQGYFYRHRERLIPAAEHVIPVLPSIASEYAQRVGQTAQREQSGREIINQLRIARTYNDAMTWRPILPGSSLKGAIRTALLDQVNGNAALRQVSDRRTGGMRKENNQELQNRLFGYRAGQFDLDPLRLVQVGDAADLRSADALGTEIRYAVNRKRQPVLKDGREIAAQAENLRQVIECIPPLRPRAFGGLVTFQELGKLTGAKLPDSELRWRFADIAAACNAFYRPIFERELEELHTRGYLDVRWQQTVGQILTAHRAALDANQAFLLRLGFHSGAESVTLNGLRAIKINMGKDAQTGKPRFEYLPVTKTVWLAAHDIQERRNLLPFGWMLVETAAVGQALAPWPQELVAATAGYHADEPRWLQTITERRAVLQAQVDKQRSRESAQQAAEELAQHESAVAAAQLASLSPEARQVAQLRELLARDRQANIKQAGGELSNTLVAVLKVAQDSWPAADCAVLADVAEEVYRFVGWPSGKKKQERQAQIAALRGKRDV